MSYLQHRRNAWRVVSAGGFSPTVTLVGSDSVQNAATGTSIATDTGINVNAGDVIILWGGYTQNQNITAASSPSVGTFTEVRDLYDATNSFKTCLYRLVATSTQSNVLFTLTFATTGTFRNIGAAVFRTDVGTFTFDNTTCNTAGCGVLSNTATSRTMSNLTTAQDNSLLVAVGIDWDGTTHTGANGFSVMDDALSTFGLWRQVSAIGSYPNGNVSTNTPTDRYFGYFVAYSITP